MGLSLRAIKDRIRSIENTKKITSAMEMVSVAKLNRINNMAAAARPYAETITTMLRNLVKCVDSCISPYFEKRKEIRNIGLCVITSDSGLCGAYNNHIIRKAEQFIQTHSTATPIKLICVGKRGFAYFKSRKNLEVVHSFIGFNGRYSPKVFKEIAQFLIDLYLNQEVDEVYIIYCRLETGVVYQPLVEKFLSVDPPSQGQQIAYTIEPSVDEILTQLIPQYITIKLNSILLDAFTAEHSARSVAMKSATDNAKELLTALILRRNKIRQASITQDMIEIISSSEALKG